MNGFNKYYSFILIVLIGIVGCKKNQMKDSCKLELHKTINNIDDSIYFSNISSITEYKSLIYLNDYKNNRIIILEKDLELNAIIGHSGKGPGEMKGSLNLEIVNDTIVAIDDHNERINIYDIHGNFIRSFKNPVLNLGMSRIAVGNDLSIYETVDFKAHFIYRIDPVNGKIINKFGEKHTSILFPQDSIHTNGHLLYHDNKLIYVSQYEPIIEKYSVLGVLEQRHFFTELISDSLLEKSLHYHKSHEKTSRMSLFMDAYIYDKSLYIKSLKNEILVFTLYPEIDFDKRLYLGNETHFFWKIAVYDNFIITQNLMNQELQLYELECFHK